MIESVTEPRARATLAAVAARAGVSASTASLAFSGAGPVAEATRQRVLAAAEDLGYAGPDPRAQSLRRGRSGIVGVVMEDRVRDAFRDPMNIAMLDGIADEIGPSGAALLLLTETGDAQASVASAPMDAVVVVGCSPGLENTVSILGARGLPIVAIEAKHVDGAVAIDLDNREATALGARHLKQLGHERVAVVTLPLERAHEPGPLRSDWHDGATGEVGIQRLLGLTDVYDSFDGYVAATSSIEEGLAAGLVLLAAEPRPTAVVAQSDLLAIGVIRAAEQLALAVPGDLSVIGFDGARIDSGYDLTTLVQPAVEKGRAAGRAILQMLAGEDAAPVAFTSEFHRGSTTATAASAR